MFGALMGRKSLQQQSDRRFVGRHVAADTPDLQNAVGTGWLVSTRVSRCGLSLIAVALASQLLYAGQGPSDSPFQGIVLSADKTKVGSRQEADTSTAQRSYLTTSLGIPTLGNVSQVQALSVCPPGYGDGFQCSQATISCPGTADIQVIYGLQQGSGASGTIVLHGGSGGTQPYNGPVNSLYAAAGYTLITVSWASAWADTGLSNKNVATAACRPATLLNYLFQDVSAIGPKCALGSSEGAAAVGYALAWYGASSYLDKAQLVSGPVFSDIAQGCVVPKAPLLTVCPPGQFGCIPGDTFLDAPTYDPSIGVGQVTGDLSCGGNKPTSAMSVVDGTSKRSFSYPNTSVSGWMCDNSLNNSAAQADIYFQQFTSASQAASFLVVPVQHCSGAEGTDWGQTPSGVPVPLAMLADMTDPVNGCVAHPR